jgi:hypothetical protein
MIKRKTNLMLTAFMAVLALMIANGTSRGAEDEETDESVTVSDTPGTDVKTLTFTEDAMERLGIETGTVRQVVVSHNGVEGPHRAVPLSAVTYDSEGNTWVYKNPAPDTFVREPITVEFMDAENMYLSQGPQVGDAIATTGVQEMIGAEFGVGEGE